MPGCTVATVAGLGDYNLYANYGSSSRFKRRIRLALAMELAARIPSKVSGFQTGWVQRKQQRGNVTIAERDGWM